MTVTFELAPLQFVKVTAFGLDYRGRVCRCIHDDGPMPKYEVEYVNDQAEIKRGEFHQDELQAVQR